jgi:hypothetical protein
VNDQSVDNELDSAKPLGEPAGKWRTLDRATGKYLTLIGFPGV